MAKPKYDYRGEEFLKSIEEYARKGYTDGEIAFALGLAVEVFSRKKTSINQISQALTRGRNAINQVVRQKYLSLGLGGVKTKTITKKAIESPDGTITGTDVIYEAETELPPNERVLAKWLEMHDEEWKQKTIELKKLDVTTNGKDIGVQLVFGSTPLSQKDMDEIMNIQNGVKGNEDNTEESSTDSGISEA